MIVDSPIRLSLCIATFNRCGFIGETLAHLLPQLEPGVEVVILDGGSADNTSSVVGEFVQRSRAIRYFRQETNNGVDRDFDRAVELAEGDYCWLMSDDDLAKQGAIRKVLQAIETKRSLYVVNAEVRSHDFSKLLEKRRLKIETSRSYAPGELDALFVDTALYLTFIGCVIIKKDIWLTRQRHPFYGTQFIHMGVIFQAPLDNGAEVIAEALVTIRYGNATWKPKEFEVWMIRWPALVWSLAGIDKKSKEFVCPAGILRRIKTLALYRAKGAYSWQEYKKWVAPRTPFLARLLPGLIALAPGRFLNWLAIRHYADVTPSAAMTLSDLRSSRFAKKD